MPSLQGQLYLQSRSETEMVGVGKDGLKNLRKGELEGLLLHDEHHQRTVVQGYVTR